MPDWSTIEFKWPFMLWALLLWPLWQAWRVWRWRRRHHAPLLNQRPVSQTGTRLLEAVALALLLLALARPQAVWVQPMREATVMLVIDTSASMKATDVAPNRLDAARAAARQFVEKKPALLQIGIVAVGGTATLAQVPTVQRDDLLRAIDELSWQNGSALGTGLIVALDALLPQAGLDAQKIIEEGSRPQSATGVTSPRAPPEAKNPLDPPRDPRDRPPAVGLSKAIVLITDGQGNMGPELLPMAQWALKHQVRVHGIGVGTLQGSVVKEKGMSMRTRLEENVLREVAQMTAGEYRRAQSASDLLRIHEDLGHRMQFEKRGVMEITHLMALLGVVLALIAASLAIGQRGHMG